MTQTVISEADLSKSLSRLSEFFEKQTALTVFYNNYWGYKYISKEVTLYPPLDIMRPRSGNENETPETKMEDLPPLQVNPSQSSKPSMTNGYPQCISALLNMDVTPYDVSDAELVRRRGAVIRSIEYVFIVCGM